MSSLDPSSIHQSLEFFLAQIIQDFMRFMKQHGLSSPQINALMYIYHAGECRVSDIGALADASNAAASQLVERLVQQGLVDRREDPADRRTKIVRLTQEGLALIQRSVTANHFLAEIMASLTDGQHATIQSAFTILAQAARHIQLSEEGEQYDSE
jgi:DNA-binding MarR family transcriptional regulator